MTWKHDLAVTAQTTLQSPKIAWTSVTATGIFATLTEWINEAFSGLGTYGLSISAILSIVLIYNNIKSGILKRKIENAEFQKLQIEIARLKGSAGDDGKLQRRSTDKVDNDAVDGR